MLSAHARLKQNYTEAWREIESGRNRERQERHQICLRQI
jgi:hypothetical protein